MAFTDSLKVLSEDVHQFYNDIGYRFGRELNSGYYGTVYESYWIDKDLDERDLTVKVIHLAHIFDSHSNQTKDKQIENKNSCLKKVRVKVGLNKEISIEMNKDRKIILNVNLLREELKALNRLNHTNVLNVEIILKYNSMKFCDSLLIFMEQSMSNLKDKLDDMNKNKKKFSEEESINYMTQIARGLAHIHSRNIAHMALKPSNILIFKSKTIKGGNLLKISDYGLSMLFPPEKSEIPAKELRNELYRDPILDIIFGDKTSTSDKTKSIIKIKSKSDEDFSYDAMKADIWSLSIIIVQLRVGFDELLKIFTENDSSEKLPVMYFNKVKETKPPKQLLDLLSKILKYDQKQRLSIIEVCNHEWIVNELKDQIRYSSNDSSSQKKIAKNDAKKQ